MWCIIYLFIYLLLLLLLLLCQIVFICKQLYRLIKNVRVYLEIIRVLLNFIQ